MLPMGPVLCATILLLASACSPLVCCLPLLATWLLCNIVCDRHDRLYPATRASAALNLCATGLCMFPTGVLLVTFTNKDDRSESSRTYQFGCCFVLCVIIMVGCILPMGLAALNRSATSLCMYSTGTLSPICLCHAVDCACLHV